MTASLYSVLILQFFVLHCFAIYVYKAPNNIIVEAFSEEEVPGIEYISHGYNIFFGNPHTTGNVDSGIAGSIFDLSNISNGRTYNGYFIPNGVSVLGASTCVQEFTYNAVTGVNSYSSTLTESAKVDMKVFNAPFSASTEYQKVYNETTTTSSTYTSTYTQCACYSAQLQAPYALPEFGENFIGAVKNMPLFYNNSDAANLQYFYDFFTKYFGTHYITQITMGGIFGTLSSMDSFSYSKYSSSNLDIKTSAKFSVLKVSGAASSMTKEQTQQADDFNSILISQSIFNIGGDLPTNNSAAAWQQSLSIKPMPTYYAFDTIPHLLTTLNFPNDENIKSKQSALQSALDDYCRLLSTNDTFGKIECSGYPPDPSIPGMSIIKGFYGSNANNEPSNPYTSGYNCNEGYTPILAGNFLSPSGEYNAFYCVNTTMNKHDALNYFGGFYEICRWTSDHKYACQHENYFTGDCSCPVGYTQQLSGTGMSEKHSPSCMSNSAGGSDAYLYLCYNASVPLSKSIMGGVYGVSNNKGACGDDNKINPYTNTHSCPVGFSPYLFQFTCCYEDGGCPTRYSWYICLNNIYAVGVK
eukprot:446643_1